MQWQQVQRTYLTLQLLSTLAASFIWGVNTLFLLDAGLTNAQAFTANAFFTLGMVIFEVPTGVVADTRGRRASYLLGAVTLLASTIGYLVLWQAGSAPFWMWAAMSAVLGLGFTFFSGAVEAWLVDALAATGFHGELDTVLARGQAVQGAAMLVGSVAGGLLAQAINLGAPYVLRSVMLVAVFVVAARSMHDIGWEPVGDARPMARVKQIALTSWDLGWGHRPVRWMMLEAPFTGGVGVYAFYAMQPHLLDLYGDPDAYLVAGLAAAIVAGAQIVGGLAVPHVRRLFRRRTDALALGIVISAVVLIGISTTDRFDVAVGLLVLWALTFSMTRPLRAAYVNGEIPSSHRATVLSADALMGSAGGVVSQPLLGRAADINGYPFTYLVSGIVQLGALPFVLLARREQAPSDAIGPATAEQPGTPPAP